MRKEVKDYMTSQPITVYHDENILKAAELIEQNNFRHLPVTNHSGNVIGMLSDRDLLNANVLNNLAREMQGDQVDTVDTTVESIMQRTVFVCQPEDTLTEAALLINHYRIGALPVIDNFTSGKLVGILSHIDLLKAFVNLVENQTKGQKLSAKASNLSPIFESALIKRWEERLKFSFPESYTEVLSNSKNLIQSLHYLIPYKEKDNQIIFASWNNVLFAFDTSENKSTNIPVLVLPRDDTSQAEKRFENFVAWHETFEKAAETASFGG